MKIYQGQRWVRERQDVRDCHPDSCRFFPPPFLDKQSWRVPGKGDSQAGHIQWLYRLSFRGPIRVEPACSDFSTHFALSSFFLLFPLPTTFLFLYLEANAKWITFYCFLGAFYAFLPRLKRKPSTVFLAWPFFFFFSFPSPPPSSPTSPSSFSPWVKERTMGESSQTEKQVKLKQEVSDETAVNKTKISTFG